MGVDHRGGGRAGAGGGRGGRRDVALVGQDGCVSREGTDVVPVVVLGLALAPVHAVDPRLPRHVEGQLAGDLIPAGKEERGAVPGELAGPPPRPPAPPPASRPPASPDPTPPPRGGRRGPGRSRRGPPG